MSFRKNITDFTIGADPEFLMIGRDGRNIRANYWCQEIQEAAHIHELGADGCGTTFECRPTPSINPIQIVNNLHGIFIGHLARHPKLLDYRWQAGSHHGGQPLGGHIHFGISNRRIGAKTGSHLLSQYVGALGILVENKDEGKVRRAGDYGGMVDYRIQSYGFEYRTPSSWLTSPYIAAAFLCLAKTVIWEAVNNRTAKFNDYVVNSDFKHMNAEKVLAKLPEIWGDITKMHLYQRYKVYIDVLYYLATNKLNWYSKDGSMNSTWGFADLSSTLPPTMALETIWSRVKTSKKFLDLEKEREEKEKAEAEAKKKVEEQENLKKENLKREIDGHIARTLEEENILRLAESLWNLPEPISSYSYRNYESLFNNNGWGFRRVPVPAPAPIESLSVPPINQPEEAVIAPPVRTNIADDEDD
jgi:hypothetical protein